MDFLNEFFETLRDSSESARCVVSLATATGFGFITYKLLSGLHQVVQGKSND